MLTRPPSRRTATSEIVPAAILRDAVLRTAPQDEVRGFEFHLSDPIGFMESIYCDHLATGLSSSAENRYHSRQFGVHGGIPLQ